MKPRDPQASHSANRPLKPQLPGQVVSKVGGVLVGSLVLKPLLEGRMGRAGRGRVGCGQTERNGPRSPDGLYTIMLVQNFVQPRVKAVVPTVPQSLGRGRHGAHGGGLYPPAAVQVSGNTACTHPSFKATGTPGPAHRHWGAVTDQLWATVRLVVPSPQVLTSDLTSR